jgi:hypothetical protein
VERGAALRPAAPTARAPGRALNMAEQYIRDWKTGNFYLYTRPRPYSRLWVLREWVWVPWWNYKDSNVWRAIGRDSAALLNTDEDWATFERLAKKAKAMGFLDMPTRR